LPHRFNKNKERLRQTHLVLKENHKAPRFSFKHPILPHSATDAFIDYRALSARMRHAAKHDPRCLPMLLAAELWDGAENTPWEWDLQDSRAFF